MEPLRDVKALEDVLVSILAPYPLAICTDAYKLSMAQAGFPLRRETFVFSFRRGTPQLVPFDLRHVIKRLLAVVWPGGTDPASCRSISEMLTETGYGATPAMREAMVRADSETDVWAPPAGSVVFPTEPLATITGPSFPLSVLEPTILMLHAPIQWATALATGAGPPETTVACADEKAMIEAVAAVVGKPIRVTVDAGAYQQRVAAHTKHLIEACGDPARLFEVGLRGAVCPAQHLLALQAAAEVGLRATSSTLGAARFGLQAVGTTGHEHQQRWGSDLVAFEALAEMRPGVPSYLFDTYDADRIGIPSAIEAARRLRRDVVVRFDSGDAAAQWRQLLASDVADWMTFVFEDGLDPQRIDGLERAGDALRVSPARRRYGVGGYLVAAPSASPFDRDRVSAAYKLSETGGRATMKWSASPGKASCPGRPVIFRRTQKVPATALTADGIVGQVGETPPSGYVEIGASGAVSVPLRSTGETLVIKSRRTSALVAECAARNRAMVDQWT